jgi:hypothetical protein
MTSAEGYLNKYRNGWSASAAAVKAWVDETVRRRGKPIGGKPPIPLSELPVSVPISRFLWPFVSLLAQMAFPGMETCLHALPCCYHAGPRFGAPGSGPCMFFCQPGA